MDSPKPPSAPHATTTGSHRSATTDNHTLENVKSMLLKCAIASTPAKSLTPLQKTFVEKRIEEFFPTVYTPDHPPYAWMVENAIKELNEDGGSTEEAISKFILQNYKELPFAHAALLKHHLRKLCESGNLVESHSHYYLTVKPLIINRASNCHPSFTSLALSSILTPSPTPSPSPSPSSSPTYASSSTSSSYQSFNLKKKRRKRKSYKTQGGRGKGRGRGRGRGRDRGRDRGRGRGRGGGRIRGRGRGRGGGGEPSLENMMIEVYADKVEDEVCMPQIQYLSGDDEVANGNFKGKEQPQARGDVENQAGESTMVIEIESPEQEYIVNEERTLPLQLEKVVIEANNPITEACLINDDATVPEWLTYDFLPLVKANRIEGENGYFGGVEQEEEDVLDGLIEEVYGELIEASQIDDQAPEKNLQNPDHHVAQASQDSLDVECCTEPSTRVIEVETQGQKHMASEEKMKNECPKDWLQQRDLMGGNDLRTGQQSQRKEDASEHIEIREIQHKINHQAEQICEANDLQPLDQLNVGDLAADGEKKMCEAGDCRSIEEECHDIKKSSDASTEVKSVEDSSTLQSMEKLNQTRQLRSHHKFQPDQTKVQFGLSRPEKNPETNQLRKLRPRPSATKPQRSKRSSKA